MLEDFGNLGSKDPKVAQTAAMNIVSYLSNSKVGTELEYAVTRLIRGMESHKVQTRMGSYSALAVLLGVNHLKADQLNGLVEKVLITNQETSRKERRLVYIARILAGGVILRTVDVPTLIKGDNLLKTILSTLVDLGQKKPALLCLATPYICHVLQSDELTQEDFESTVWPCLLPLFGTSVVKAEEDDDDDEGSVALEDKDNKLAILYLALTCYRRGLKTDFEFLNDMDKVVKMLLTEQSTFLEETCTLLADYLKTNELGELFWSTFISKIRSSHFNTTCICVEKCTKEGIPHSFMIKEELVLPLLQVFRNKDEEAAAQRGKAVVAFSQLMQWDLSKETGMQKKERKAALKILFGGTPNILHEYKILGGTLNLFLHRYCTKKDLKTLTNIIEQHLEEENGISPRMCIVYLTFLTRLAQSPKSSEEIKIQIGKKLLKIGFGVDDVSLKHTENDGEANDKESAESSTALIRKCSLESFQSVLSSEYNAEFLDEMVSFVLENIGTVAAEPDTKKLVKKADKLRSKTEDAHWKYIVGAYALKVVLEQEKVLGEAKSILEEVFVLCKSSDATSSTTKIVGFIVEHVAKDAQPPFNYAALFSRFVKEDKISEDAIQVFGEAVDVELDEAAEDVDSEDEESSDEDQLEVKNGDDDEDLDEDIEPTVKSKKGKDHNSTKVQKDESDDDDASDLEVDMDQATEEDLKSMDNALAKVFATKKKVKDEEHSEVRKLMRLLKLLETFLIRKSKGCQVSVPLLLVMPLIHALQNAARQKKTLILSTRIVYVLNKLNAIKSFEGADSVEPGSLLNMAKDIATSMKIPQNKGIVDLLGDSLVMLTKCYLQGGSKTEGENLGFLHIYLGFIELGKDKRNKSMGGVNNVIASALTTVPNWPKGKDAIADRMLAIIFNQELRVFRRHQFLILLRATLMDHQSTDPTVSQWKPKVMKKLTKSTSEFFAEQLQHTSEDLKNFAMELLSTLAEGKSNPLLKTYVEDFVEKLQNNSLLEKIIPLSVGSSPLQKKQFKKTLRTLFGESSDPSPDLQSPKKAVKVKRDLSDKSLEPEPLKKKSRKAKDKK